MSEHPVESAATTSGLPVAPSMGPTLRRAHVPMDRGPLDRRVAKIGALAIGVAVCAALAAQLLTRLIALVTNVAFFGRFELATVSPAQNHLGAWVVLVPVVGALVVGAMARYGSPAIRGHGIPEAMEQILENESRIPVRMTFLKPLSAAISIGTGGPFGAEGPIIATGGALGSLLGQLTRTSASERKTLLAAGAAAGMAATFGTPLSAVLLAVELLLFEFRSRSLVPVALATATATGLRIAFSGHEPAFAMPALAAPSGPGALIGYALIGAVVGVASVVVTRAVYAVEDAFARLPIHWMWWPALGAVVVGVVGFAEPRTLGVGYDNIEAVLGGSIAGKALVWLCAMKFLSWSISLGSGTSGGTLAPLLTLGGGLGAGLAGLLHASAIDPRVAALVGMAAMFAGASRALLASVVFAFESTHQAGALLPILAGGAAGYLVSSLLMQNSIMTEKIERRGVRVPSELEADLLDRHRVDEVATSAVIVLDADATIAEARELVGRSPPHQGFPVVERDEHLVGVIMRRELMAATDEQAPVRSLVSREPVVVFADSTLRAAVQQMTEQRVGRLPVLSRTAPHGLIGILTRKDIVGIHVRDVRAAARERTIQLRRPRRPRLAWSSGHLREVDHDLPGHARDVRDRDRVPVARAKLIEQRQRIVVVAEAHRLAGAQRVERAEDRRVPEALGDAARVEGVELVGLKMQMSVGHVVSWSFEVVSRS